jgi:hypothetical protein
LLYSQSTIDVFSNPKLLKNIRESKSSMNIHGTAGVTETNLVGTLPGYGTNCKHVITCKAGYNVSYSSSNGKIYIVTKPDGTVRNFKQSNEGLFNHDTKSDKKSRGTMIITNVADKQHKYSNRDYSRAALAWKIQQNIGRLSTQQ